MWDILSVNTRDVGRNSEDCDDLTLHHPGVMVCEHQTGPAARKSP